MTRRSMIITFVKTGRGCAWTARRPPRTVVPGPTMAAGGDLPHDVYTYVIEHALGLEFGFWGCVAAGATFKTLGRKRTAQGREIIDRHRRHLEAAEVQVNEIYFDWKAGRPTVLDDELNAMLGRWRALPDGGELVVEWPAASPRRSTSKR